MNWLITIKNENCPFLGTEKDFDEGDNKCHYSESIGKRVIKSCEKKTCPIVNIKSLGYHNVDEFYKE